MEPKVSVVMTTYNRADVVSEAIESILNQTFTDFEFVIVDDGCSDRTPQVLQEYARRDKRIVIYRQDNQGLAAARNTGVARARGKYIMFMDDDDLSSTLRLERQLSCLEKYPDYAACVCNWTTELDINNKDNRDAPLNFFPVQRPLVGFHWAYFCLNPFTMITKESFMACGGYRTSERVIEDLDFTFRFWEKYRMVFLDERLYHYQLPLDGTGQRLSSRDPLQFAHRHIACYVSAWCRLQKREDPVNQGCSLEEILHLVPALPWSIRYLIYKSLEYFVPVIAPAKGCSYSEVDRIVMDVLCIHRPFMVCIAPVHWMYRVFFYIGRRLAGRRILSRS